MYRFFVKRQIRRSFDRLSRGDYEPVLKRFGPSSLFRFSGDHELGGERLGTDQVRDFFERTYELFPSLQMIPLTVVVNGGPRDTVAATRLSIRATLDDGREYRNEGMQFLRLRWGRVVEDYIYEDTQKLVAELERMGAAPKAQEALS
jgi:ketosteroid isomerase-like protein